MPMRPAAVAFDVIETLFPLDPLRGGLAALGLQPDALQGWFAAGLRDAFALAATGGFSPLRAILDAGLDDLLARAGLPAPRAGRDAVLDAMATLPAHADAAEAMDLLAAGSVRIVALSNGAAATTEAMLRGAGLRERVEAVVSVDEVRLAKPRREVYLHAAARIGVEPGRVMLVAAHPWDVHGAKSAGLAAGFVARGRPFPSTMTAPDLRGDTLAELARTITALGR